MTAKKYVEEVGKLLKCRMAKKKEIKRQLLSEINDAVAKGETVDAVLKRMGIPWDYANQYNDRFDKAEWKAAKREKAMLIWGIVLLISLLLLGFLYSRLRNARTHINTGFFLLQNKTTPHWFVV